ncbi:Dynein molecular motor protein light chain 1 [Haplosporangium sp. Z 767]|nr:Dynein molecular motor protein light chain 1 [Haplosporangium sp. Z 11]KAF9178325.1 Dynein molecular motor protein light chain 1 [Haplosporangium sp. Z 767]
MALDEKPKFDIKTASQILEEVVKKVLKDAVYRADLVPDWQAAIYQESIARLTQLKGTFKYIGKLSRLKERYTHNFYLDDYYSMMLTIIGFGLLTVTSTILESVGAGVHISSTSLWDAESDGSAVYRFENKSLIAFVYAFGLSV